MKTFLLVVSLTCFYSVVNAQDTIARDLRNLAKLKLWSDLYVGHPTINKFNNDKKNSIRDSIYFEYTSLIFKVKNSPNLYLTYINKVLKENPDSLRKETVFYNNPTPTILYNYNAYSIKVIDLYRVIKYSLFDRDDAFLPEDFHNLNVVDPKNYYGYYEPEPKLQAAIRYIISKFSLTIEEKKFLRNKLNVGFVMDIKKFLDTSANTLENKQFIKSSIATFVKSRKTPLAGLYFYHQLSKDTKNYIPGDREVTY